MTSKQGSKVFRSFEQFKVKAFPRLTKEERRRASKETSHEIGSRMADEAIEQLLRTGRKTDS